MSGNSNETFASAAMTALNNPDLAHDLTNGLQQQNGIER
jgi:hypothetical protein